MQKKIKKKCVCFVTGVPGAGKTLVGLDVVAKNLKRGLDNLSVYLSGNGPLVEVLREALKKSVKEKKQFNKQTEIAINALIQSSYGFKKDNAKNKRATAEKILIFDEAQRSWTNERLAAYLKRGGTYGNKLKVPNFPLSEAAFLIWSLDQREDWAVIVCLVGGGQEINTGEAGISEWIESLNREYKDWHVFISDRLHDAEYAAGRSLELLSEHEHVEFEPSLHLAVSMRSFRAENLAKFVHKLLDRDIEGAREAYQTLDKYPIVLTRSLDKAKRWLKDHARGTERYGMIVSSQAERLKPLAIDVRFKPDVVHWFLDDANDVRSSFYLEDVATEFDVQGLELDWSCVVWDGDFRYTPGGWSHHSFCGDKWQNINKPERKAFQKNAYRVLLTRARQGMVLVVPEGNPEDPTRNPAYYDSTYEYLKGIKLKEI